MSDSTVGIVGSDEAGMTPAAQELAEKRKQKLEEERRREEEYEKLIPHPCGYKILIVLPQVEDTFGESGLVKPDEVIRREHILSMVGLVLELGSQAYADKERFPEGAWCKEGDYVMFPANTGTRFRVGNKEYRLLNDDSVEALVDNPRAISRA